MTGHFVIRVLGEDTKTDKLLDCKMLNLFFVVIVMFPLHLINYIINFIFRLVRVVIHVLGSSLLDRNQKNTN